MDGGDGDALRTDVAVREDVFLVSADRHDPVTLDLHAQPAGRLAQRAAAICRPRRCARRSPSAERRCVEHYVIMAHRQRAGDVLRALCRGVGPDQGHERRVSHARGIHRRVVVPKSHFCIIEHANSARPPGPVVPAGLPRPPRCDRRGHVRAGDPPAADTRGWPGSWASRARPCCSPTSNWRPRAMSAAGRAQGRTCRGRPRAPAAPPRSGRRAAPRLSRLGGALTVGRRLPIESSYVAGRPSLRWDFRYGMPSLAEFPLETWQRCLGRTARRASRRAYDYGAPQGSPALRGALAAHLGQVRGVPCTPEQIVIVSGSQQGLDLVARVLIDPRRPRRHRGAGIRRRAPCVPLRGRPAGADPGRCRGIGPRERFPTPGSRSSRRRTSIRWAVCCRGRAARPCWRGPRGAARGSSRTTTTASTASTVRRFLRSRRSTPTSACSTSAPSRRSCSPPCASATSSARRPSSMSSPACGSWRTAAARSSSRTR